MKNLYRSINNEKIYEELYAKYKKLNKRERQRKRADHKAKIEVWPVAALYLTLAGGFIFNIIAKVYVPNGESDTYAFWMYVGLICIVLITSIYIRRASVGVSVIDDITKNNADYKKRHRL